MRVILNPCEELTFSLAQISAGFTRSILVSAVWVNAWPMVNYIVVAYVNIRHIDQRCSRTISVGHEYILPLLYDEGYLYVYAPDCVACRTSYAATV